MHSFPKAPAFVRRYWPAAFISAHFLKLALLFRDVNFNTPFPLMNVDYALYFARALRAHEFFLRSGRFWGYDPFDMAGYICGPVHELGNLFTSLICHLGMPFVPIWATLLGLEMLGWAVAPFFIYGAVRLWTGKRVYAWAAFAAFVLTYASLMPFIAYMLTVGLFSYFMAVFVGLLWVALFSKLLESWSWARYALVAAGAALLPFLHPVVFIVVAIPVLAAYGRRLTALSVTKHGALVLGVALVFAANWIWIRPYWAFSSWVVDVRYGASFGMRGFVKNMYESAISPQLLPLRLFLNGSVLLLTVLALRRRAVRSRGEAFFFGGWLLFLLVICIFGSSIPLVRHLQPGRFVFPFWLVCYALAAAELVRRRRWRPALNVSAIVLLIMMAATARTAATFTNAPEFSQFKFLQFLQAAPPASGRIMVESSDEWKPMMSDLFAPFSAQPLIGGGNPGNNLITRSTLFSGNFFDGEKFNETPTAFGRALDAMTEDELKAYLGRYNVVQVAARYGQTNEALKRFSFLKPQKNFIGSHLLYDVDSTPSWFLEGTGDLKMDYDRLTVTNASKGILVLKSHWLPQFKTDPVLPIRPRSVGGDPVPFIEIDNAAGLSRIEVYNAGL